MKVLVIGKGGREHALVWKLAQSPRVDQVFCAPGNAGTALDGANVGIETKDFDGLIRFAKKETIGLTVVGPEDPLAKGIVDAFQKAGLKIFGPSKAAAQIEASKVFAKKLMRDADVPTAEFRVFDHPDPARLYVQTREYPVVVKADGLAAGKGVLVCSTTEDAMAAIERIMVREEFGLAAGRQIIIEKRLDGQELSVQALVAGRVIVPLAAAQDHKRAFDGDTGPNTGGMGAYSPAPLATPELLQEIESQALVPTVHAMKRRRVPFRGVLYAGVMATNQGTRILEYNCRLGDPETQPLFMRLKTDLFELLEAAVEDRLDDFAEGNLRWDDRPAVCVVMASGGYPGAFSRGKVVLGLDEAAKVPDVKVFHAGTKRDSNNLTITDGGRVLGVTALGDTLAAAKRKAYEAAAKIHFQGAFYRKDIGDRALQSGEGDAP
ncbi:MAG: phosphoribosylamine--glycine ligase [Planctomycetes bacterium]|nr:phosphoribosylamine--glycine ligase [Planctomycetota bacterium]